MEQAESFVQKNHARKKQGLSRRHFLKNMGCAAAGGAAALLMPDVLPAQTGLTGFRHKLKAQASWSEELYWTFVMAQFQFKPLNLIYMNTGTEGSMPRPVLDKLSQTCRHFAEQPMDAVLYDERCCMFMTQVLPAVAAFLGAGEDEIVMTTNTTEGLGWVANGLDLEEGDEVITTLHFLPYNACWYWLRDRKNITLTELEIPTPEPTSSEIVDLFKNAINAKTKVISFCHINYATGLRMPVREICELARDNGIVTLVDGAHATGMIEVNLQDLGVDYYATSCHKWLCAPPGTGVLYIRKDVQGQVWPTVSDTYLMNPGDKIIASYFQFRGQQMTPAIAGVKDAIEFQDAIGKEKIERRVLGMSSYMKQRLIENWGEESLLSPRDETLSTGLVSFNPFENKYGGYGDNIAKLFYGLWDKNIITRSIGFKNRLNDPQETRVVRFSTHIYNDYRQIDAVVEQLKPLIDALT